MFVLVAIVVVVVVVAVLCPVAFVFHKYTFLFQARTDATFSNVLRKQ